MPLDFNPYPVGLRPGYSTTPGEENIVGEDQTTPTATSLLGRLKTIADNILTTLKMQGAAADGTAVAGYPVLIGGTDGTYARSIATDAQGRIVTAPQSAAATTAGFAAGYVSTAATIRTPVRSTIYTEQTTNAQRSLVSTSANDTVAGTGARSVKITYLDQTGAGPYTETVTLNGTTAVNTTATNICFIEKLEVVTVGSGGVNAGTISLKATINGGGATVWSIPAGDNQTFGCHHYTPFGQTSRITGLSISHNGNTATSGGLFTMAARPIGAANAVERQISDFVRLYGQSSGITRNYGTPLQVVGPAKITMYVTPESGSALTYRCAFDFYDQGS